MPRSHERTTREASPNEEPMETHSHFGVMEEVAADRSSHDRGSVRRWRIAVERPMTTLQNADYTKLVVFSKLLESKAEGAV